jgi:hypothetical protein
MNFLQVLNLFLSLLLSEFNSDSLNAESDSDDEEENDFKISIKRIEKFLKYINFKLCCCFSSKNIKSTNEEFNLNG